MNFAKSNFESKKTILKLYRIVDANLNRAREGLRVIEDVSRFYLDDSTLTKKLKRFRHEITDTIQNNKFLIYSRDSFSDVGNKYNYHLERGRKSVQELVIKNFKRVEESMRVLEDISKIIMPSNTSIYKDLRFKAYSLEKKFYERI